MFQIGDKILDKNGHIFSIDHIENKNFGAGDVAYFVMKPCFPYDFNSGYVSYVPVDKSDVLLRPIMNKEEALSLIDSFKTLEVYPEVNPRERKMFFTKVISGGNREEICRIIKTLVLYRKERMKNNKPFSDYDRRLLDSLTQLLQSEISIVLNIPVSDVFPLVFRRTGFAM